MDGRGCGTPAARAHIGGGVNQMIADKGGGGQMLTIAGGEEVPGKLGPGAPCGWVRTKF